MKMKLRSIRTIIAGMVSIKMCIFITLIIGAQFAYEINYINTFKCDFGNADVLSRIIMPINQNGIAPNKLMQYLLPLLYTMMLCGSYYQNELNCRCRYTIPRFHNIYKWYNANIISLIFISAFFSVLYYIINLFVCRILNIPDGLLIETNMNAVNMAYNVSPLIITLHFLYGFGARILLTLMMQLILILKFQNTQTSIAIPLALHLVSIMFSSIWIYIPFGSTQLIRVINNNEKMSRAYLFMCLTFFVLYITGIMITKNRKFLARNAILR